MRRQFWARVALVIMMIGFGLFGLWKSYCAMQQPGLTPRSQSAAPTDKATPLRWEFFQGEKDPIEPTLASKLQEGFSYKIGYGKGGHVAFQEQLRKDDTRRRVYQCSGPPGSGLTQIYDRQGKNVLWSHLSTASGLNEIKARNTDDGSRLWESVPSPDRPREAAFYTVFTKTGKLKMERQRGRVPFAARKSKLWQSAYYDEFTDESGHIVYAQTWLVADSGKHHCLFELSEYRPRLRVIRFSERSAGHPEIERVTRYQDGQTIERYFLDGQPWYELVLGLDRQPQLSRAFAGVETIESDRLLAIDLIPADIELP